MSIEYLKVHSEAFDNIVQEIKQRNLTRNNMPKIIVGTGLSVIYGVPGMGKLTVHLTKEIERLSDKRLNDMWQKHIMEIEANGLELGLSSLMPEERELVDLIKSITAKFIIN